MSKLQDPVLVVDDEADIRDLMEMTLMKMGLRLVLKKPKTSWTTTTIPSS